MDEREIKKPGIAPEAILAGNGFLFNRRLVFAGESGICPVAVPSYGDRVYGALYFISNPVEVKALKSLRHPLPCRVTRVRSLPYHRIVFAVTFEAAPDVQLYEGPAAREYRDRMAMIARERDLPREYISFLEMFPTMDVPLSSTPWNC